MILCTVGEAGRYRDMSPEFGLAVKWLQQHFGDHFAEGIVNIADTPVGPVYAKYEATSLLPREKAQLELHRRFIDIHVPLKATETIGWAPEASLQHCRTLYDSVADIAFYGDAAHSLLHVKVGQMAVFFPEDAHAPNIGLGTHRKICIKIPVGTD